MQVLCRVHPVDKPYVKPFAREIYMCYADPMDDSSKKMTPKQAGQKGGFIKWSKVSKKKRSEIMRKVALARYKKNDNQVQ